MTRLIVAATLASWTPAPVREAIGDTEVMPVPADLQVPLIIKTLRFDRNFDKRQWTGFHVGVVFVAGDPVSARVARDVAEVLTRWTIRDLPIASTLIEYVTDIQVEDLVKSQSFNMLYITPGIGAHLQKLLQLCQGLRIITTTGVPEYVEKGVAVGIGIQQDKAQILINLRSSRAVGSEFDASLLRMAQTRVLR